MKEKRLKSFAELKYGDKIIITSNTNGHDYMMNVPLVYVGHESGRLASDCVESEEPHNSLDIRDVVKYSNGNKQDMINELNDHIKNIKHGEDCIEDLQRKINYLEETGREEFEEKEYVIHEIMKNQKKLSEEFINNLLKSI